MKDKRESKTADGRRYKNNLSNKGDKIIDEGITLAEKNCLQVEH